MLGWIDGFAVFLVCLLGFHRFSLYLLSRHSTAFEAGRISQLDPPLVTVQLPVYNERFVVDALLDAIERLDYPRHRLEVQVLDDSDDGTVQQIAARIAPLQAAGLDIVHLRRSSRAGFKAGALASGMQQARGEFIAIFDADFVPEPDFLQRALPHFSDPRIGLVQARWGHSNRGVSWLTRVQALQLDAHFLVEHTGRQAGGFFLNFNGTAGILRRRAIEECGGWQSETLTEDLDLSCRALLRGWRFVVRPELIVPSELPERVESFKGQQRRWVRGSVQTARKMLPSIWRSGISPRAKLEASLLLLANGCYPLFVTFAVSHAVLGALSPAGTASGFRFLDTFLMGMATLSLAICQAAAAIRADRGCLPALLEVPMAIAIGAGISVNNTLAYLQGWFGSTGIFERTPKAGSSLGGYRAPSSWSTWLEIPLAVASAWVSAIFWGRGWWGSAGFYALFSMGLGYLGSRSWLESGLLRSDRSRSSPKATRTGAYSKATTQPLSSQSPPLR